MTIVTERQIELADLIALRQVGIEVLLAVPLGETGDLTVQPERRLHREIKTVRVQHRQRPRKPETNGTRLHIGMVRIEGGRTAAKNLRLSLKLNVDFQTDDDVVGHETLKTNAMNHGRHGT